MGTSTTSGIYAFTSVGSSSRYISASIPVGAEVGAVAEGMHLVELYDPDDEIAVSSVVSLVDGQDNPLSSSSAGSVTILPEDIRAAVGLESANLGILVNGLVGKNVPTDNGDGTVDITIRNEADDANLRVVRINPTTGSKTIVE